MFELVPALQVQRVRSGYTYTGYGFLRNLGVDGDCWVRSGATISSAYYMNFSALGLDSSAGPRFYGFSLRCLQE